ncbi:MAG: ArnT family glycosyltransferase [Bacteroidota bacterium]
MSEQTKSRIEPALSSRRWQDVWIVALLFFIAAVRFVNLGYADLQPWDESLYAIRAETIIRFGDWVDQSAHSIGGLYSAVHPPLYVWLTALAYRLFGINEFSARVVSALAGAFLVLVIYLFARDLYGKRAGVIAAALMGLQPMMLFWSRQGQFDMLLVLLMTLSVYLLAKCLVRSSAVVTIASGIALGFALLTKLFVALIIPVSWLAALLGTTPINRRKIVAGTVTVVIIAVVVAAPWHIVMAQRHAEDVISFFFRRGALLERTFSGIEGNVKSLGWLYYINQLAIGIPVAFTFGFYQLFRVVRKLFQNRRSCSNGHPGEILLISWATVFFLVFAAMKTKLAVYALPIAVPLVILGSKTLDDIADKNFRKSISASLLIATWWVVLWALFPGVREATKGALRFSMVFNSASGGLAFLLSGFFGSVLLLFFSFVRPKRTLIFSTLGFGLIASACYIVAVGSRTWYDDGAKRAAELLDVNGASAIIAIGNDVNPQLTFYLRGADLGWRPHMTFVRLDPAQGVSRVRERLQREFRNDSYWIVLERDEIRKGLYSSEADAVPSGFMRIFESRGYSVYKFMQP